MSRLTNLIQRHWERVHLSLARRSVRSCHVGFTWNVSGFSTGWGWLWFVASDAGRERRLSSSSRTSCRDIVCSCQPSRSS